MSHMADAMSGAGGLHIIGAGFGRTGTFSLKNALDAVGFGPCYHMSEVFGRPQDIAVWQAAADGEPVDWRALLADYRAIVDWPGCAFYDQLMDVYPDAKVILTVRDPDAWYESATSTIFEGASRPEAPEDPAADGQIPAAEKAFRRMVRTLFQNTFSDRLVERAYAIAVYNQHNDEVRRHVPQEKLLVYDVKDGWAPLCAFLGIAVPDEPFPSLNSREEFIARNRPVIQAQE